MMKRDAIEAQETMFGIKLLPERRQFNYWLQGGASKKTKQVEVVGGAETPVIVEWNSDDLQGEYMQYDESSGMWKEHTNPIESEEQALQALSGETQALAIPDDAMPTLAFLKAQLKVGEDKSLWTANNVQIADTAPALGPWISVPQLLLRSKPVVHVS